MKTIIFYLIATIIFLSVMFIAVKTSKANHLPATSVCGIALLDPVKRGASIASTGSIDVSDCIRKKDIRRNVFVHRKNTIKSDKVIIFYCSKNKCKRSGK